MHEEFYNFKCLICCEPWLYFSLHIFSTSVLVLAEAQAERRLTLVYVEIFFTNIKSKHSESIHNTNSIKI